MPIYRRLPKRGFNNIFKSDFVTVSLGRIQAAIDAKKLDASATIDAAALKAAGVIRRPKDGVRVLADGELTTKVSIDVAAPPRPPLKRSKSPVVRSSWQQWQPPNNLIWNRPECFTSGDFAPICEPHKPGPHQRYQPGFRGKQGEATRLCAAVPSPGFLKLNLDCFPAGPIVCRRNWSGGEMHGFCS